MDNKIFITLNYTDKTITIDHSNLTARQGNLSFSVVQNETPINLKFGFHFYVGTDLKFENEYSYLNCSAALGWAIEPPIHIETLAKHQLKVWMDVDGEIIQESCFIENVLPPQPFPSWSWNSAAQEWQAPIPHPGNGQPLGWDESRKSWVLRTL